MPLLIDMNPQNLSQVLNLVLVMDNLDNQQLKRGEMYVFVLFTIYFIQFLWIGFQVVIRLQTIEEVGELYTYYSVYNMCDVLYYIL